MILVLAQGVDGIITFFGVGAGLVSEANPLMMGLAGSAWIIPIKFGAGFGLYMWLRNKVRLLAIATWVSLGILIFNIGGLIW